MAEISKKIPQIVRKKSIDWPLCIITLLLVSIGLVMLFSASYVRAYFSAGDSYDDILSQVYFAIAGIAAMIMASILPYNFYKKFAYIIYVVVLLLNVIPIIFSQRDDQFKRWFTIPGLKISIQPSEFGKFALVILLAMLVAKTGPKLMKTLDKGFFQFAIWIIPLLVLLILQQHLSATLIVLIIAFVIIIVGGFPMRYVIPFVIAAATAVFLVVYFDVIDYATDRIAIFLDPFDPNVDGYQTIQSLYTIASGGLTGKGLGNSRQKYLYLPESQNDFIFSIVAEELGFVGAILIILLFIAFVVRGYYIAIGVDDIFGKLVVLGIVTQIGIQALLNIAVATNSMPPTGISLPFFSSGGSSLLMIMAEVGVVLNISKSARKISFLSPAKEAEEPIEGVLI